MNGSSHYLRWFALAAILVSPHLLMAQSDDQRLIVGLRERRLFTLAEEFCRERLAAANLGEIERAELTVELIDTHALHAIHAPAAERARLWQQVEQDVAAFRARRPSSPRQLLVDVQGGLAALARAELARQELDSGPRTPPALAAVQEELRTAIKGLQGLREEAARLLRLRNRQMPADPVELTANELIGVQQHLHYQLGRAYRSLAESFPEDSPDWISNLQQAIAELKPLADSGNEHPLAWQARLDDVACRRLLKDKSAGERLTALRGASPPPRIQLESLGEAIRLAVATGDFALAEKWAEEGSKIPIASANFDLARLELQIAAARDAAKRKDEPATRHAQDAAATIASEIASRHGTYWNRRAQVLLAGIATSGALSNLDILAAAAAQHLRFRRLPEAIAAYDQAASQARAAKKDDRAFSFGWVAAAIELQERKWSAAQERFLKLAADFPANEQSPSAHWNAITCAGLVAQAKSPPLLDEYVALLEEHLKKWPAGATADKARWWLGQTRQSQRRWQEAAEAFRGISAEFADYPTAIRRLGECIEHHLEELQAADAAIRERAANTVLELDNRILDPEGKSPAKWGAVESEAAIASATLRLRWLPNESELAERQLSRVVRDQGDGPLAATARLWLVAAYAANEKYSEATRTLNGLANAKAADWQKIVRQLQATSRASPAPARKSIAEIRLAIVAKIEAAGKALSASDQLDLLREKSSALLDAGRRNDAIQELEVLAKHRPEDGAVAQQLAELYEGTGEASQIELALAQWRLVLGRSALRSERWYRANLGVANCLFLLDRKADAKQAIELMLARPPGLEKTPLKKDFLDLLKKCGG